MSVDHDPTEAARRLARAATDASALTRRRFLQAALAAGGAGAVAGSPLLSRAAHAAGAAAAAGAPGVPGVLVLVNLQGGNDGLNTVVPYGVGAYHDARGPLALDAASVLRLDGTVGLHPSLGYLHGRWAAGQLAVVEGVGDPTPDLSHFTSMARWMSGSVDPAVRTGWLGRHLDVAGSDDGFDAVCIGSEVPLTLVGARRTAVALSVEAPSFGASADPDQRRLARAVGDLAARPTGRGDLADAVAAVGRRMLEIGATVGPLYPARPTGDAPVPDLELAARVVNAGLGVRVVNVTLPGFDTHAGQLAPHAQLLARLDAGLARFFALLDPAVAGRVAVLVVSEFGRAVEPNGSGGTDHGTAGVALLLGDAVRGGRHGTPPSFAARDGLGQLRPTVDARSVFASVLRDWLGGDDGAVFGAAYDPLDLFRAAPAGLVPVAPVAPSEGGLLTAVRPVRVLDTRRPGAAREAGPVPPGGVVDLVVAGEGAAVPAGATAVVLNVTATEPTAAAYVTVWPTGLPRPLASNLNVQRGDTVPNLVVASVGQGGAVSLYSSAGHTHLVVDLVGHVGAGEGGTLVPVAPFRLLDTRLDAPLTAGTPRRVQVAGRGDLPAAGLVGVVANVTATGATTGGYVTVWPAGEPAPLASNLNLTEGQTVPNLVLARLADGAVELATSAARTDVVIDVVGIVVAASTGTRLVTTVPTRVLDTRVGTGASGRLGARQAITVTLADAVPAGASAAVLNLTAVAPSAAGFVTAWPAGGPLPATSNLNLEAGRTRANLAVVSLGADRAISLYNALGDVDLVADLVGWFV